MEDRFQQVENYLSRLASGDRSCLAAALQALADHTLFSPVSLFVDVADTRGTKKAKVITLLEEGRRLIPAFSSEDHFFNWAQNEYQCLPMRAGDFVLTFPVGTGLVVNPGLPNEVEFSPDELQTLSEIGNDIFEEAEQDDDTSLQAFDDAADLNGHSEEGLADLDDDMPVPEPIVVSIETMTERLASILRQYPEVLEAYYAETHSEQAEAVLGLLTQDLSLERRFLLIAEIAELSRAEYRYAGAIETYTDLHHPHSSSWELFKLVAPFYVKESVADVPFDQYSMPPPISETESGVPLEPGLEAAFAQPGFSLWRMFKSKRARTRD